jgi:HAD superfamily, subfamily IIIB (Acid phosphatase)
MTARTLAATALLALLPAAAAHADNRDYVDSGQYLADVTTATAPASSWLLARTDTIARQSELCRTAGFPLLGDSLTPGPATGSRAAEGLATASPSARAEAEGTAVAAVQVAAVPAARVAGEGTGVAPAARATAVPAAPYGATTLTVSSASPVGRVLRRGKVSVSAMAPAGTAGQSFILPVARGSVAARGGTLWSAGALRFAVGKRVVSVKDIRLEVSSAKGRLVGAVGGRRMTVLTLTVLKSLSLRPGVASARALPATLTPAAATVLRSRLGVHGLRAGRIGTLALAADLRRLAPATGQGTATSPAATTTTQANDAPPTPGEPGLTVVPATRAACAATPAHPALVLDLDETALSNYIDTWGDPDGGDAGQAGPAMFGQSTAMAPVLALYREARARGVAVFLITARPGIIEAATRANLQRVGYTAYEGLSFKNDLAAAKDTYKSAERAAVEARGYRIILNVGDQQTDLAGGHAERAFKLPNPFY